jgi:glucose-1-phosphate thymidylyltransferase
MEQTLKIAIPMAGFGTRLRPHTWSKAKPLIPLAGRTILDYVLDQFSTLPDPQIVEYVFIVGPNQEEQIRAFMQQNYPHLKTHYTVQTSMRGQSDALWQAREYLSGPMLMVFSDTLIDVDFSVLKNTGEQAIAWVKVVDDPTKYGVVQLNGIGNVKRLIEKPKEVDNRLAVVGFYYFPSSEDLLAAIQEQFERKVTLKNEYFLADAINVMLEKGLEMRPVEVSVWLDAGMNASLLETNRYLLEHGNDNSTEAAKRSGVEIVPPVFIDPSAQVICAVLGPYVSVGRNCVIENVIASNTIIDESTQVRAIILKDSLLGRNVQVQGKPVSLNLGDNSWMTE